MAKDTPTKKGKADSKTKESPKKSVADAEVSDKKKSKKAPNFDSLATYIRNIESGLIKTGVNEEMKLEAETLTVIDHINQCVLRKIAMQSLDLCKQANRKTISVADVENAVRAILPESIREKALEKMNKSLESYKSYSDDEDDEPLAASAKTKEPKKDAETKKKKE